MSLGSRQGSELSDTGDRPRRSPIPHGLGQSSRTDGADWTSSDENPISLKTKYAPKEAAIVNANAASIVFIAHPLLDQLARLSLAPLQPTDRGAVVPTQDQLGHHPSRRMHLPSQHYQYKYGQQSQ